MKYDIELNDDELSALKDMLEIQKGRLAHNKKLYEDSPSAMSWVIKAEIACKALEKIIQCQI